MIPTRQHAQAHRSASRHSDVSSLEIDDTSNDLPTTPSLESSLFVVKSAHAVQQAVLSLDQHAPELFFLVLDSPSGLTPAFLMDASLVIVSVPYEINFVFLGVVASFSASIDSGYIRTHRALSYVLFFYACVLFFFLFRRPLLSSSLFNLQKSRDVFFLPGKSPPLLSLCRVLETLVYPRMLRQIQPDQLEGDKERANDKCLVKRVHKREHVPDVSVMPHEEVGSEHLQFVINQDFNKDEDLKPVMFANVIENLPENFE